MGKGKNQIKLKKVTELPPKASVVLCFLLWRVWVPPLPPCCCRRGFLEGAAWAGQNSARIAAGSKMKWEGGF